MKPASANTTKSLVVALHSSPTISKSDQFELIRISESCGSEITRPYVLCKSANKVNGHFLQKLCEISVVGSKSELDSSYRSFAVNGQYICGNGDLHTITPVDPLFWLLRDEHLDDSTKSQWQPLEQILQQYDPRIVKSLQNQQIKHLTIDMDTGNEVFTKISVSACLIWLTSKQKAVEPIILEQLIHSEIRKVREANGAFASGFNLPEEARIEPSSTAGSDTNGRRKELERGLRDKAKTESVQAVCNYLSKAWTERFIQHLNIPSEVVNLNRSSSEKSCAKVGISALPSVKLDWNSSVTCGTDDAAASLNTKSAATAKPITAGAKRLLKANKKGMQKMSSFFTAKKPKNA